MISQTKFQGKYFQSHGTFEHHKQNYRQSRQRIRI